MTRTRRTFDEVLGSDTMHMDGTSIPVLDRDEPGGIKVGQLWGYIGVDIRVQDEAALEERRAVYLYTSTGMKLGQREGELGPEDVLEKRRGRRKPHVVADAAGIFDASFKKAGLIEVGCNMHGRRYFSKALDAKDARAALPLAAFKKLYDIEERLRGKRPEEKLALRDVESRPVYDELLAWAETYKNREPPKSALGTAVRDITGSGRRRRSPWMPRRCRSSGHGTRRTTSSCSPADSSVRRPGSPLPWVGQRVCRGRASRTSTTSTPSRSKTSASASARCGPGASWS